MKYDARTALLAKRRFNEALPYPRWEDEYWHHERTVYGKSEPGLGYEYVDRLDCDRRRAAEKKADKSGAEKRSAKWFSEMMSAYEGKKVRVRHVTASVDGAGNSIYCLGFGPARRKR